LKQDLRTRTVSPSVHPRPASGGAADFFPASALSFHQQALRPPGGEDARCVRPISATQTNAVHPHLARSRLAVAAFAARTSHGVLGSVRHDRGTGRFTTSEDRFGGSSMQHCTRAPWSHDRSRESRAWAFSSHGADATEPLTPLSRSSLVHPHASRAFARAAHDRTSAFWLVRTGRRMRRSPRSPSLPSREREPLVMIRDAFHR
jgi:hypothetical protein